MSSPVHGTAEGSSTRRSRFPRLTVGSVLMGGSGAGSSPEVDVELDQDDRGWVTDLAASPVSGEPSVWTQVPPRYDGPPIDRRLVGRTALVTGATTGLGRALARTLVGEGAQVLLLDDDLAGLRRTSSWLGDGSHALVLRCDLGSIDDVLAVGEFIHRTAAPISLVVHAAGVAAPGAVTTTAVDVLDEHYLISVRGPYVLSQQVLPQLTRDARFVFFDRRVAPDAPDAAHHAIVAAARAVLVDALRDELEGRVAVVAVRVDERARADDVAAAVLPSLLARGPVEPVELSFAGT